jgi:septum formation protein
MTTQLQLYLASSSPRRQELLQQIGLQFACLPNEVPEDIIAGEPARAYADRLALAKAQAGWQSDKRVESCPVLGADTIVVMHQEILGKPRDKADFLRMIQLLSGRTHEVITAIAMVQADKAAVKSSISRVAFREISLSEAEAYWETGEPADKAGGYGIQGKGAVFIKHILGSHSGIMGLPLYETAELAAAFGISLF